MLLNDDARKLELARGFHAALAARDWAALSGLFTDDAVWVLPGNNTISGRYEGKAAVVQHAGKIAAYGLNFALEHVLVSRENFALALHNTARRGDVVLDEHLATVCFLRDGLIARIETYLSDVPGMNAFFL
jgi:hypothetical protein